MNVPKSIFRQYDVRGLVDRELTPEFARALGRAFASVACGAAGPGAGRSRSDGTTGPRATRWPGACGRASPRRAAPRSTSGRCPRRRSTSRSRRSAPTAGSRSPARTIRPSSTASRWCWRARPSTATRSSSCGRSSWPSAGAPAPGQETSRRLGAPALPRRRSSAGTGSSGRCGSWWTAATGSGSLIAVSTLRGLGAEVTPLFCESDGTFPNHHPDPTVPENLRDLQAEVRRTGAELGHRVRRRRRPDRRRGRDRRDHLRRPAAGHLRPRRGAPVRARHPGHLRREVLGGAARGADARPGRSR